MPPPPPPGDCWYLRMKPWLAAVARDLERLSNSKVAFAYVGSQLVTTMRKAKSDKIALFLTSQYHEKTSSLGFIDELSAYNSFYQMRVSLRGLALQESIDIRRLWKLIQVTNYHFRSRLWSFPCPTQVYSWSKTRNEHWRAQWNGI